MPIFHLIEYSDNYSKKFGSLWHYYRDEPFLNANGAITDFSADNNNSVLFKFKIKLGGRTGNDGTNMLKLEYPSKYLNNFWRSLEMQLVSCEINIIQLGLIDVL